MPFMKIFGTPMGSVSHNSTVCNGSVSACLNKVYTEERSEESNLAETWWGTASSSVLGKMTANARTNSKSSKSK